MHYNLGERQRIKKPLPYRRTIIGVLIALVLVGGYLIYSHHKVNYQKPPVVKQQPQ